MVTVLYDEDCGFCRWSADELRAWDRRRGLTFVSIQNPRGAELLHAVPVAERLDSMHAVTPDGRVWSGGRSVPVILAELPGGSTLASIAATFPGTTEWFYRLVARHRQRLGRLLGQRVCSVDPSREGSALEVDVSGRLAYGRGMAVAERQMRIQTSLAPFLRGILGSAPLLGDPDACDFLAGNPEVPALPGYVETLQKWLEPQDRRWFAYGMPDPRAAEAASAALADELGLAFDPEDIILTRGAHGAMALAMATVLDPGDEVVFISPPWFFYEALILGAGATPVRVRANESTWDLDLDAIGAALSARTRMVLINTPNNPTGRIYPDDTLALLASLLERRSNEAGRAVYLLSDEAYSKILFDGNVMRSPASHYARTLVVHTFSKSTLAPAERLGYLAMPPTMPAREALRQAAMSAGLATSNMAPDAVMQYALPDLLHITVDMERLQLRRDRLLEALRAAGYQVHTPEGTFYLLVRSPIDDEGAFVRRLAQDKILAMSGDMFEMPGYFRLSITATDDMVERAIPVFEKAISETR
ncbi:MAG: aminotransferase class I/II-fold pyridoxal phosphate-dependent enzyme [Actinobacteria bacterium]|nr:MAG: aminotransferase class I/II-fold pyridoxal phosphate-dependent enzyme [Actinomycetota bacterium]TMK21543.1 MAG: aminotransferase class I/II-fold pyridoxal phosphate-dependent enzyme [Actinomycetota bacterium]TMK94835.1 MAG: aminotransferase class I/II-fold pyridoxal phosphate-dependent enzyme [Actinomycetota bacterium]